MSVGEEHKRNQYWINDNAIVKWLQHVRFKGVPVPVVFATPDRAWGDMHNLYDENGLPRQQQRREIDKKELDNSRIFLPFCSVNRTAGTIDVERYNRHRLRKLSWRRKLTTDPERKFVLQHEWPNPVNFEYDIEFWCATQRQMNVFRTYLIQNFRSREMFLRGIPHYQNPISGTFRRNLDLPLVIGEVTENSDLEPGEGRRSLRFSMDATLRGWLFPEVEECRTVLETQVDLALISETALEARDWEAGEVVDTVVSGPPAEVPGIVTWDDFKGEPSYPRKRNTETS